MATPRRITLASVACEQPPVATSTPPNSQRLGARAAHRAGGADGDAAHRARLVAAATAASCPTRCRCARCSRGGCGWTARRSRSRACSTTSTTRATRRWGRGGSGVRCGRRRRASRRSRCWAPTARSDVDASGCAVDASARRDGARRRRRLARHRRRVLARRRVRVRGHRLRARRRRGRHQRRHRPVLARADRQLDALGAGAARAAATPGRSRRPRTRIAIYELHIRDFSIGDTTVPRGASRHLPRLHPPGQRRHAAPARARRGGHDDGAPAAVQRHRDDRGGPREAASIAPPLEHLPPDSPLQQRRIGKIRDRDGFNWGYDPLHYTTPGGLLRARSGESHRRVPRDGRGAQRDRPARGARRRLQPHAGRRPGPDARSSTGSSRATTTG